MRESERLRAKADVLDRIARTALADAEQKAYQEIADAYRRLAEDTAKLEAPSRGGEPPESD